MKCKDCIYRLQRTRGICKNEKSDNYSDYVAAELECEDGETDEQRNSN
jgi:hypothetical protein